MASNDDDRRFAFLVGGYNPDTKEFSEFLGEFNKESDRGAVLSSTAYIDSLLANLLGSFLINDKSASDMLRGRFAPLGAFSARALACHAMGLISDDERDEIKWLRKVRNEFAHEFKMSFSDSEIEKWCAKLKFITGPNSNPPPNTRMRFTSSAVNLITRLAKRPRQIETLRLKPQPWS
jgi:hypothetical protein